MPISGIPARSLFLLLLILALLLHPGTGAASGPKWVAGGSYFSPGAKGTPVVWANGVVSYYLDQGALSTSVSNSQAAMLVAGAAAVWSSVPTAAVRIQQGGSLAEDVNGSNVTANTPGGTGATLPADVQPAAITKPVAVVFDADGSVINAIYGPGSSDPTACTQDGVYTSVDNLSAAGTIAHALIVVNGLCASSPALEGLLQYKLVRAFGQALGLDWSQVNESMWPSDPTTEGLAGWPVMHPLERLCTGSMTSCMPNPTTLRPDDIAGLNQLYPVTTGNIAQWPGKTLTASSTLTVQGTVSFRGGQGMQGVNVVLTPVTGGSPELQYTVAAVSGAYFRRDSGNVITGSSDVYGNPLGRFGTDASAMEGAFVLAGVPLPPGATAAQYQLSIEPVDPLYTGANAVGPYDVSQVSPSGAVQVVSLGTLSAGSVTTQNFTLTDSADGSATDDGVEPEPNAVAVNGEWISKLVGFGHVGWFAFHARANRVFTVEAAALDSSGLGTESKAAMVIGLWNGADAFGASPDLASVTPFNGAEVGLSNLTAQTSGDGEIRIAFGDERGDGRPDFLYRARVLYADRVTPPRMPLAGGTLSIEGQGFHVGTVVLVNGQPAAVTSVTPTEITAIAPAVSAATGTVPVEVEDPQTLGTAQILDGFSYDAHGTDHLRIIAAPSGTVSIGVPVPLAMQVLSGDEVTPAAGVTVTFAVTGGVATLGCGSSPCSAVSNGQGMVTILVTPMTAQATTVSASLSTGASLVAEFDGGTPPQIAATNTLYIAGGVMVNWQPVALVLSGGSPVGGATVSWSAGANVTLGGATSLTNAAGDALANAVVGPLAEGSATTVTACEGVPSACATFAINAVQAEQASLVPVSGIGQVISMSGTLLPVTLEVVDAAGHPLAGATVNVYQQMTAWEPPCPTTGRCPTAPLLGSSAATLVSGSNGLVTFTPMSSSGQPAVIAVEAATGNQGSFSFTLTEHP